MTLVAGGVDLDRLAAQLGRVLIRICGVVRVQLRGHVLDLPATLTGERFSAADCGDDVTSVIVAALIDGRERGFIEIAPENLPPRVFGWVVRSEDAEPMVGVSMSLVDTIPTPLFTAGGARGQA